MKLYARLHNHTRKIEGMGSDDRLIIELTQKNKRVATIIFVPDFIEVWTMDDTGDHYWCKELEAKGKKEKGECVHEWSGYPTSDNKYKEYCLKCGKQTGEKTSK